MKTLSLNGNADTRRCNLDEYLQNLHENLTSCLDQMNNFPSLYVFSYETDRFNAERLRRE